MQTTYHYKTPYENDFIYDNTKVIFDSTNAKLKEQYITSSSYLASLDLDFNKNSDLVPIDTANVIANSGWAEFTDNTIPKLKYNRDGNFAIQQGTMRCKYKSTFTGNPPKNLYLFGLINNTSNVNTITLGWVASGKPTIYINNALGTDYRIIPADNILTATVGQEIDFEMSWDLDAGIIRIFVDGILFYSVNNAVMTRNSNATLLMLGNLWAENQYFYGSITDFQIFDRVLHTSDFTPSKQTFYTKEVQSILSNASFRTDEVFDINSVLNEISGEAEIRGILNKDGQDIWYNIVSGQMEISDGSWSQANTLAEFKQYFVGATTPGTDLIKVLLKSYNGDKTPSIENIVIDYCYSAPDIDREKIETETLISDMTGDTNKDLSIEVMLVNPGGKYKDTIVKSYKDEVKSIDGKFSYNFLETDNMDTSAYYIIRWQNFNEIIELKKKAPSGHPAGNIFNLPNA